MKIRLIISAAILLLSSQYSNAQSNTNTHYMSPVTKGYYSIGRNAEKLNNGPALQLVQTSTHYTAQKGYYTINEKRYKLPKFYKVNAPAPRSKTQVKKGYYSIGENSGKL
jgi:hypothetical protein